MAGALHQHDSWHRARSGKVKRWALPPNLSPKPMLQHHASQHMLYHDRTVGNRFTRNVSGTKFEIDWMTKLTSKSLQK
jgi:hypothetical protein